MKLRKLALALVCAALLTGGAAGVQYHEAYIFGFPDGTVRPEELVSREQGAQILYRMLCQDKQQEYASCESAFSDVLPDRWSYEAVTALAGMGVLYGYPDGSFRPAGTISRAELAVVLVRIVNLQDGEKSFPDVYDHWAGQEISFAAGNGWVAGYADGTFQPDAPLCRAELMAILNRVLERQPESLNELQIGMKLWPDNLHTDKWYFLDVQEATTGHSYQVNADGRESWTGLG